MILKINIVAEVSLPMSENEMAALIADPERFQDRASALAQERVENWFKGHPLRVNVFSQIKDTIG